MIDVYKARFGIVKRNNTFCFIVKYDQKVFIAAQGTLDYLRPKFTAVVKDRKKLEPVIRRKLGETA